MIQKQVDVKRDGVINPKITILTNFNHGQLICSQNAINLFLSQSVITRINAKIKFARIKDIFK